MSSEDTSRSVKLRVVVVEKLQRLKEELGMSNINDVVVLLLSHYERCMSKYRRCEEEGHAPGSGQ